VILVKQVPQWKPEFYSRGLRLAVPRVRRNPTESLDPNIKSGNYLNNILALTQAVELGADDCLIVNGQRLVTESSNSNVFFVIDGRLLTPSQATGNLRGITKATVTSLCQQSDLPVEEGEIHVDALPSAAECFVTSATREVMPVRQLLLEDGQLVDFPMGGGYTTRRVAAAYRTFVAEYVRSHHRQHPSGGTDPVETPLR
jgi:branched-chain amino acid aminotransferase